ncbi:hypothetical protein HDU99_007974, partial [Rhizoclosmatium hyalinum]
MQLTHIPDDIFPLIFRWIAVYEVFRYRLLSRRINSLLLTKHFATMLLTNQGTANCSPFHPSHSSFEDVDAVFFHAPSAYQSVYAHQRFSNTTNITWSVPRSLAFLIRFPNTLWELQKLESVSLDQFNGPVQFPSMSSNITQLELQHCKINGPIPVELWGMISLTSLYLSTCGLTGSLSPLIQNLIHLKELAITSNNLTGQLPPDIGSLSELKDLSLTFNKFS